MAETKKDKAVRYLTEGRLRVTRVDGDLIVAECRGDGTVYDLGHDRKKKQWRCTCEASAKFHRECSHLIALRLVTATEGNT